MTREEAIKALQYERKTALHENKGAFDMAIEALSAEPCEDTISRILEVQAKYAEHMSATSFWQMRDEIRGIVPVAKNGDIVSRQAVKDKYKESLVSKLKDDDRGIDLSEYAEEPYKAFCEFMDSIPPVTPQQKMGRWTYICNSEVNGLKIVKCSECGKRTYGSGKFCPNCGAKMAESEDAE